MDHLGIDPSERNTGLALLKSGASLPMFGEVHPKEKDLLSAVRTTRIQLFAFLKEHCTPGDLAIAVEKQGSAGSMSLMMFYIMMGVMETIVKFDPDVRLIAPVPIQLKSYMKRYHQLDTTSKTTIVTSFMAKNAAMVGGRKMSSDCVDAYYLACALRDVLTGKWAYKPTSRESKTFKLFPINIIYGDPHAIPTGPINRQKGA